MACNDECQVCIDGGNGVNGRYCYELQRYVEYEQTPPCHSESFSTNSNKGKSVFPEKTETCN